MNRKLLLTGLVLIVLTVTSFAQVREIPQAVRETFANQYPKAESTDFKDWIAKVDVRFVLDGENMVATYGNKGDWKGTEKDWRFDELEEDVKDGFQKSKYAEWDITETKVLYLPGGSEQYRVRVKKNDVQKKYLFFNTKGRLLRESITL
ncbi:MAG: PepSY-like domain-containing protein [Chitinophagaceae bacterium]